jgi:hypothetical protein
MPTTTSPRRYSQPRPTSIRAEDIPAPADAVLIPAELQPWLTGFCTRCDRAAMVSFGGPDGLCPACNAAQVVDINTSRLARAAALINTSWPGATA